MGFVLSILYLVTFYLTPGTVFGALAAYRVELVLAVLVILASLPKLISSSAVKTPQSLAVAGLAFATFLSVLVGVRWPGGAVQAFLLFIPNALAYFLVAVHCDSKKKLQILILTLLFVCLFVLAQGTIEMRHGPPATDLAGAGDPNPSSYLLAQENAAGEWFYRMRGLGQINDPNDFAQLCICVLPLLFIFWTPKSTSRNIAFVVFPVCVLLYGVFLTHSRGATLALIAMVIVAARRRIGTLPALLLAIGLYVGAMALHFTGGRDISADSGQDRLDLWGAGLQLLLSHPLFGIGYERMLGDVGQTAHNSVIVCAAELGMFGLYFWALFLFPTIRDVLTIASPAKVGEGEPIILEKLPFPHFPEKTEEIDKAEINRLGRLLLLSFTGFLVAAWFLSRAFVLTLFLLGGIAEVVFAMALQRRMVSPRLPMTRALRYAAGFAISLVVLAYAVLRIGNLMR